MRYDTTKRYTIRGAEIGYGIRMRNFSGVATDFNSAGNRSFCLFLTDEQAEYFTNEGLNVKWLHGSEDRPPKAFLSMTVKYRDKSGRELRYPPEVRGTINGQVRVYTEEDISELDSLVIQDADVVFHGAKRPDKENYTNYVDRLGVNIETDWFNEKYGM